MARQVFVKPQQVRLELSEGDWIMVHRRLSFGEQEAMQARCMEQVEMVDAEGKPQLRARINIAKYKVERMVGWMSDWSFADDEGNAVDVSREAIESLDPDIAGEIDAALDAHLTAQEANPTSPTPTTPSPASSP